MIDYWRIALSFFAVAALGACSLDFSPPGEKHFYTLEGGDCRSAVLSEGSPRLVVRDTEASSYLDTQKITFRPSKHVRGSYQDALWAEPPPEKVTRLIVRAFECSGLFSSVSSTAQGIGADYILKAELTELYHDVQAQPSSVFVQLRFELYAVQSHSLIGTREFTERIPVESFDAPGAVEAFDRAMVAILNSLTDWARSKIGAAA